MNFDAIEDLSWKEFRKFYDEDPVYDNRLAVVCSDIHFNGTDVKVNITCKGGRRCSLPGCANRPEFAVVGFDCGTGGLYHEEKEECCGTRVPTYCRVTRGIRR